MHCNISISRYVDCEMLIADLQDDIKSRVCDAKVRKNWLYLWDSAAFNTAKHLGLNWVASVAV